MCSEAGEERIREERRENATKASKREREIDKEDCRISSAYCSA